MKVFLDADASPVTDIVIKVCENLHFELIIVKNFSQQIYSDYPTIVNVDISPESADLYIVNHLDPFDLVITQDRGLSALCLSKRAYVMDFFGSSIDESNIELHLATRHANRVLRDQGIYSKNKKRKQKDNSAFEVNFKRFLEDKTI
ncbi:hypothetical protein SAMN02745245_01870 [Anaerosphaera aminiphila DSM 21120]|uniref:Uncharacterized protein n=1 Tax=Anaerosphaera aminiphila DSM 21120 TaxID=1120995 RepID=A0A1M5USR0_9FIRM|nr:DUF188 domain-containing protein [Anaerosphaera aminiphila]SHH66082.1 hypothetical protein SAMN02745245_01870 [Anaerosphaera aminiphila DSM 21120]